MSNVFVDGFATYGLGSFGSPSSSSILTAMLAGRYAAVGPAGGLWSIGTLPWAPSNPDLCLGNTAGVGGGSAQGVGARVALPAASNTVIASFYVGLSALPTRGAVELVVFSDLNNNPLVGLAVTSTGALILHNLAYPSSPANLYDILASTSGPVMTAQNSAHIEIIIGCGTSSANSATVQVNGTTVITVSGQSFSYDPTFGYPHPNAHSCSQLTLLGDISIFGAGGGSGNPISYLSNLIIRDGNGTVNNGIVGDRRVATLFVNGNDAAHQGWTAQPIQRFGAGVLDLSINSTVGPAMCNAVPAASLDIGSNQFTIEGNFRFQVLPAGALKSVLYSHWDETLNHRECELYVGGPSLEGGNIVFRTTTDGTGASISELISWPYPFVVGHYYHVAVSRDASNKLRLFINGVLQGVAVTDASSYYAGGPSGAVPAIGADTSNGNAVAGTTLAGWVDEFRLTIGACRYTATFTPPAAAFPRGVSDPNWAQVAWLSGFDSGTALDESSYARTLGLYGGALAVLPADGAAAYQVVDKAAPPFDNSFIEASLLAAQQNLTYTALPANNATITVGQKTGPVAAVYTWKTTLTGAAFEVLIGASVAASLSNLQAAIIAGAGSGTLYGTGTTANIQVSAAVLGNVALTAVALTAGAAGNSIACSSTDANGTWGGTTLTGGADIPAYSQFTYSRLPSNVTIVDSITLLSRSWKTDAGVCTVKTSFVGGAGGVAAGANQAVTTAPNFYTALFESDPDTAGPITPTTVTGGKIKVDRTS
jgi:hypothetical protein